MEFDIHFPRASNSINLSYSLYIKRSHHLPPPSLQPQNSAPHCEVLVQVLSIHTLSLHSCTRLAHRILLPYLPCAWTNISGYCNLRLMTTTTTTTTTNRPIRPQDAFRKACTYPSQGCDVESTARLAHDFRKLRIRVSDSNLEDGPPGSGPCPVDAASNVAAPRSHIFLQHLTKLRMLSGRLSSTI